MRHRHYDIFQPFGNDDMRQFFFVRNSGLPLGTFPRRTHRRRWPSVDRVVVCVVIALGLIAWMLPQ